MALHITDYHSRLKQHLKWEEYITQSGFTHYVTFNFNFHGDTSIESAISKLMLFGMMINRKLHGQNFHKKPSERRTRFVAFIEHKESNLHYHAALTTPDIDGFNEHARAIWSKLVQSGDLHIECKAFSDEDVRKIAAYITKDFGFGTNSDYSVFFA